MARVKKMMVTGINGGSIEINDNHINKIIVSGKWNYDKETETLTFEYEGYDFNVGPEAVEVRQVGKKKVRGTTSCRGEVRGRNIYIKHGSIRINISRLWLLCRELVGNNITIANMDEYVLNHKDNQGLEESWIEGTEGLEVDNYELVKQLDNYNHGEAWYKVKSFGDEAKFSAQDYLFLDLVNLAEDKYQLLVFMNLKHLNPADYRISEVI